ncbi:MAG: hypothetical protein OXE52_05610 [Chloroflexi bacterium]|nr:hypothetical protein [Chloroflexota bacterium]
MKELVWHIILGGLLGAVIGAVGFFLLAEGMTEGLFGGVIIGGSVGALPSRASKSIPRKPSVKRDCATRAVLSTCASATRWGRPRASSTWIPRSMISSGIIGAMV